MASVAEKQDIDIVSTAFTASNTDHTLSPSLANPKMRLGPRLGTTIFPRLIAHESCFSLDRDSNDNVIFLTDEQIELLSFGYLRHQLLSTNININPNAIATVLKQYIPFVSKIYIYF